MNDEVRSSILRNGSMSNLKETYAVASVKAFIKKDGKILILRESADYQGGSHIGRFIMPGGKVNENEGFRDTLKREVKEECGLEIEISRPFSVAEWYVQIPNKPKHIVATYFVCDYKGGDVKLNEEFDEFVWIDPKDYDLYDINRETKEAFVEYLKIV